MKTKLLYLSLLIITFSVAVKAQTYDGDSIRFSGIIFDKDSLNALPFVKYTFNNVNYTTNAGGEFYTWAK
jgi:hypothetical protein